MEELLTKAKSYVSAVPKGKLYTYLLLLVMIVGGSVTGLSLLQKETYHTLFAGLSMEDASMIVTKLKEQKIPYRLGMGGNTISVPKDKVYDVRLLLASQNSLPGGGGVGFELFDKTNYGMTEFMQNINYKRAIQGELSRTINQMPEVKGSRIHLAIPEKAFFNDKEKDVTASVFLKMKPGKVLAKDQVSGIVQLVSGSIEGLKPENVSVIDSSGKILYKGGEASSPAVLSAQQFELQKGVEKRIEESVQSMLDKFIPASKSIVRANVELNLRKVEKVEEEYLPGKSAITAEKKSREKSTSATPKVGGVPGVSSNSPQVQTTAVAGAQNPQAQAGASKQEALQKSNESEREESQISYEVSKSVRKIVEPFGEIKKISLAIVLDGKYEKVPGEKGEGLKYVPRSQKELNDVKSLVARAVGYDEARGDKIEVMNIPFETESFADEKGAIDKAERNEMIFNLGKYGFYAAIFLSVFLFLVHPLMDVLKRRGSGGRLAVHQAKDIYVKGGAQNQIQGQAMPALEDKPSSPLMEAMKDKALVGSIIREWVKEGT